MGRGPDRMSVSVVVAALNEEADIEDTLGVVRQALDRWSYDWEILIFDDGSTDHTPEIAERLAAGDARIRAFHHDRPRGLGGVFRHGIAESSKDYVILVNGKNDTTIEALEAIFAARDGSCIVIPFTTNMDARPASRRVLSAAFTSLLNAMHGLGLRYYNHSVLYPKDLVRSVDFASDSYAFQAEILIKLLRSGAPYVQVGVEDRFDPGRTTRAFSLRNIAGVAAFIARTAIDAVRWRLAPGD